MVVVRRLGLIVEQAGADDELGVVPAHQTDIDAVEDRLVAPGTEIEFQLTSQDTAHGFRILGQQIDIAIPKRGRGAATVRFAPPAPGTYVFECSRMCGAGHSFMRGTIRVKETADRKAP